MLTAEYTQTKEAWIDLRQQANYWKVQHAKAIEREARWKNTAQDLEKTVHHLRAEISDLTKRVETLTAQNAWLKQRLFGEQTEKSNANAPEDHAIHKEEIPALQPDGSTGKPRPRGQQSGASGHGRKRQTSLPILEIIHDLPEHEKVCSCCGLPFKPLPFTQDSEEIHYEVHLVRRIHKRTCYTPACQCGVALRASSSLHRP